MRDISDKKMLLEDCFIEQTVDAGYIDNIFNYHVNETLDDEQIPVFLEKLRILLLLKQRRMSETEIGDALWENFRFRSPYLSSALYLLIKAGFVGTMFHQARDGVEFLIERRGLVLVDHLFCQLSYIENVFPRCYFPASVARLGDPRTNSAKVRERSLAAIVNGFIMLQWVRNVEDMEIGETSINEKWKVADKLCAQLKVSIRKMVMADSRKLGPQRVAEWLVADARIVIDRVSKALQARAM